jgi:hypothetical protein
MIQKSNLAVIVLSIVSIQLVACQKNPTTFSLLGETNAYQQIAQPVQSKVDVLWVIDNSGSMRSSQESVAANFQTFMQRFMARGYDFQMAVTTTDAYRAAFFPDDQRYTSQFVDGTDATSHSGIRIINAQTPNLESVFITNILQGIEGNGDERAFQSMRDSLNNQLNADFVRDGAFLAIIIVSDEDDFSHDSPEFIGRDYYNPAFHTVQSYVDYLDALKPATSGRRNYSVSAIAIFDEQCLDQVNDYWTGRIVGYRYSQLINATGGVKGSLCSEFGDTLKLISDEIVNLTTRFQLTRIPQVDTIEVFVNSTQMAQDELNGWTYHADDNVIIFHGTAIPPDGAKVEIFFDPIGFKE